MYAFLFTQKKHLPCALLLMLLMLLLPQMKCLTNYFPSFMKIRVKAAKVMRLFCLQLPVTLITSNFLGNNLRRHVGVKSFLLYRA